MPRASLLQTCSLVSFWSSLCFFFILPLSNELSSCSRGRSVGLWNIHIVKRLLQSEGKGTKKKKRKCFPNCVWASRNGNFSCKWRCQKRPPLRHLQQSFCTTFLIVAGSNMRTLENPTLRADLHFVGNCTNNPTLPPSRRFYSFLEECTEQFSGPKLVSSLWRSSQN